MVVLFVKWAFYGCCFWRATGLRSAAAQRTRRLTEKLRDRSDFEFASAGIAKTEENVVRFTFTSPTPVSLQLRPVDIPNESNHSAGVCLLVVVHRHVAAFRTKEIPAFLYFSRHRLHVLGIHRVEARADH